VRILQVTTHIDIGGIANYILNLSGKLKAKGLEVIVASSGGNLENEFRSRKIPHQYLDIKTKFEFAPKVMISAFRLARIIKDEKIDIVHAHTRASQVAVSLASRLTGVPYVTTCHGYFELRSRKIFDTWGNKVIAIGDAVALHLKNDLGVKEERIENIYSGVDVNKFGRDYTQTEKDAIKRTLGLNDGPIIGTIGRLSPVKGQKYLVEAMGEILAQRKETQCLIIGDGKEEHYLKELARTMKIEGSVHFVASCPDTAKFLSVMDVFVFPSVKEGLGIALLEAMAAGKACVASDIGGIGDIIKDPSCGLLVPVGDIKAIAGAIITLLDKNILRQNMGEAARKVVRENFSLDVMTDKVIQLYKKVCNA
jgi:glycosyltransferase involved in cell wall biosynthesis